MAIILRRIKGQLVALCAARIEHKLGDTYIDDDAHHALSTKFMVDFESEGLLVDPPVDDIIKPLMLEAENAQ